MEVPDPRPKWTGSKEWPVQGGRGTPAGFLLLTLWLMALLGSACLPAEPATTAPLSPAISSPLPTPTATIVWFPPTETPTPLPTVVVSPTPNMHPGIGAIIFADDFITGTNWIPGSFGKGNVTTGAGGITLAITQPKAYLSSLLAQPAFDDFYLEITASTSLCKGPDEYGILVRAASPVDFYRFSLSCDGQVKMDRIYRGVPSSPQPWMISSTVPSAAPAETRLAVWASGAEMRFFLDDTLQFTIKDRVIPRGNIGVFARSQGETAVTVRFSDLVVRAVSGKPP